MLDIRLLVGRFCFGDMINDDDVEDADDDGE
ncbi:unnamed protein product, partial [Adineta steineri]